MKFFTLDEPLFLEDNLKLLSNRPAYGAFWAYHNFYKALLRYSSFDEIHFFSSAPQKKLKELSGEYKKYRQLKIISRSLLPYFLEKFSYTVFFQSNIYISRIAALRNFFSRCLFPICGFTHTISYPQQLKEFFLWKNKSFFFPCDSIICSSMAVKKAMVSIYNMLDNRHVKEYGVNFKRIIRFDSLPLGIEIEDYGKIQRKEARAILGLPQLPVIVLYFGRFSRYDKMNLEPLLKVYKKLISRHKDVLFIFAGSNNQQNYGNELKKKFRNLGLTQHVHFYFDPSEARKKLLYSASDVFVSPSDSIQESFGLSLLEAMASGLAVVVSDWNGYKDIVEHGVSGFLIPVYWADCIDNISLTHGLYESWERDFFLISQATCVDMDKMFYFLNMLIKNKNLRMKIAQSGQERVKNIYHWKMLIRRYEDLWKKLYKISKTCEFAKARQKFSLFNPDYFLCFKHYPSRIVNRKDIVEITRQGYSFLEDIEQESASQFFEGIFSFRIALIILELFKRRKRSQLDWIVQETRKFFKSETISEKTVLYHLMWLLKNNYLKMYS